MQSLEEVWDAAFARAIEEGCSRELAQDRADDAMRDEVASRTDAAYERIRDSVGA